jgi:hypothetical protein
VLLWGNELDGGFLLLNPTTEVLTNVVEGITDKFKATNVNQTKVVQKPGLVAENCEFSVEGSKIGQFVTAIAGFNQICQDVVKSSRNAVAQDKFMVAGQFIQMGYVPLNQVVGFLNDREVFGWGSHNQEIGDKVVKNFRRASREEKVRKSVEG